MRIAVTGSSGRIGEYVVRDLGSAGHDVLGLDIIPGELSRMCVDLTDAAQVFGALESFKPGAVVHLGAWPNPGHVPHARTYGDNVTGTFNVLQACADLGIRRVVSASSGQVYGLEIHAPDYVRLDEEHPLRPVNCYAESKLAGESAARYFSQNGGPTVLSFRFVGVRTPAQIGPEVERMAKDPSYGAMGLWTRTDARDAAMACRKAVEVETVESGAYNISGPRIAVDGEAADYVRAFFGDGVEIRQDMKGTASPLSSDKAGRAFGYEPRYGSST
jgi:nucleoside-diphosphate-sugar epimerase